MGQYPKVKSDFKQKIQKAATLELANIDQAYQKDCNCL